MTPGLCVTGLQLSIVVSIDGLASTHSGLESADGDPSRAPHTSALERILDELTEAEHVADVPCVDGSELARDFFTFAVLVGAAMCSAC